MSFKKLARLQIFRYFKKYGPLVTIEPFNGDILKSLNLVVIFVNYPEASEIYKDKKYLHYYCESLLMAQFLVKIFKSCVLIINGQKTEPRLMYYLLILNRNSLLISSKKERLPRLAVYQYNTFNLKLKIDKADITETFLIYTR